MAKTEEKKGFHYPHSLLEKFADEILDKHKGDFYLFLKEKKALTEDGKAVLYYKSENYYKKYVEGTPYNNLDDFYRPEIPMSFWSRIYDQAEKIITAKVEDLYAKIVASGEPDPRIAALNKVRAQLYGLKQG